MVAAMTKLELLVGIVVVAALMKLELLLLVGGAVVAGGCRLDVPEYHQTKWQIFSKSLMTRG